MKQSTTSYFPDTWKEKSHDLSSWLKEIDQVLASDPNSLESKLAWVYCNLEKNSLPAIALSSPLGELFPRLLEDSALKLSGSKVFEILAGKLSEKKQYKLAINFYEKAIELAESHESLTGKSAEHLKNSLYSNFKEVLEKELLSAEKRKESRSYKEALEEKIANVSSISIATDNIISKNISDNKIDILSDEIINPSNNKSEPLLNKNSLNTDTSKNDNIDFLANQNLSETSADPNDASNFKLKPIRDKQVPEPVLKEKPSTSFLPLVLFALAGAFFLFLFNSLREGDFSLDFLFKESASLDNSQEGFENFDLALKANESPEKKDSSLVIEPATKSKLEKVVSETSPKNSKVYSELSDKLENMNKNTKNSDSEISQEVEGSPKGIATTILSKEEAILEPQEETQDPEISILKKEETIPSQDIKNELKTLPKLPSSPKREVVDTNNSREELERKGRRRSAEPLRKARGVPVNKFDSPRTYEVIVQTDVYTAPSLRSSALVRLERGAKVQVIARFGRWLELKSKEGNRGFIFAQDAKEK